jgi:hypothetical protein
MFSTTTGFTVVGVGCICPFAVLVKEAVAVPIQIDGPVVVIRDIKMKSAFERGMAVEHAFLRPANFPKASESWRTFRKVD